MKVGDRARDRASGFTGTVVGMDTASDTTLRVCLEADPSEADNKEENFGKPPRLWTSVANAELIDADGNVVRGKPGGPSVDTAGRQVGGGYDASGREVAGGAYDSLGRPAGSSDPRDRGGFDAAGRPATGIATNRELADQQRADSDADRRQHDAAEQRIADQRKALEAKTPAPGARPA